MTTVKKSALQYFDGAVVGEYLNANVEKGMYPQQRYLIRAEWVSTILQRLGGAGLAIVIEGYSLNSKGKIDSIIENASTLKTLLYLERGVELTMYPPATIKKFASGKGNADKEKMILSFIEETGWDIHEVMTPDKQFGSSPVADIVDSYYVCKQKFYELKGE